MGGGGGGGPRPFFSYISFHATKTENDLLICVFIQIMLKCSKTTFNFDVEGAPPPLAEGGGGRGASASSINRAASRSFYVVEVKTVKMEHLNHWFSKKYRIYEQQPK